MTILRFLPQAYQQAPGRILKQRVVIVLAVVVAGLVIAIFYLWYAEQTASNGIAIENLKRRKEDLVNQIANYHSKIASLSSEEAMKKRAEKMGFILVSLENAQYLVLPGYIGRSAPDFSQNNNPVPREQPELEAAYTQSLWDLLWKNILNTDALQISRAE